MSETKWIVGPRQSGRSTELIELSAATGLLIVTGDNRRAECLYNMAKRMGKDIRKPEPIYVWIRKPHQFFDYKMENHGVLVDDADFVLSCLLKTSVTAAVVESDDYVRRDRLAEMGIEV